MIIGVIDGMGGGIGSQIITNFRKLLPADVEILALGINPVATGNMMKAQANQGATGENAIRFSVARVDVIVGPLAITIPNSMLGEVSLTIAEAVSASKAKKFFLPILPNDIDLIGVENKPLLLFIREIVEKIQKELKQRKNLF